MYQSLSTESPEAGASRSGSTTATLAQPAGQLRGRSAVASTPKRLAILAADGCQISGYMWQRADEGQALRPIVIINSATSVRCRYYFRFAEYLFDNGFDVVVYDYRGIGESRPPRLRGFAASWSDWGALDFEAVLTHVHNQFPGRPIQVVGHSFGGCATGMAASGHLIDRVFTVGAQYAYWRDYAGSHRLQMLARWHVFMPLVVAFCRYFPGRRLGWLEDTPSGVAKDWSAFTRRLEDRPSARHLKTKGRQFGFAALSAPMLALSVTDDPFGTVPAIERLLGYFSNSDRTHLRLSPASIGVPDIGHFGFFHSKFAASLWPIALTWLQSGLLHDCAIDHVVSLQAGGRHTPQEAVQQVSGQNAR